MDFSLRHIGIVSQNLESSQRFWEQAFDFKVFWDKVEPSPYISQLLGFPCEGLRTVKMSAPSGHVIELLSFPDSVQRASVYRGRRLALEGISHMAINVDDVELALTQLLSLGANAVSDGVQDPPGSSVRVAYVLAPDNVYLELVQT
jgi:catechol 2,3-dioxygenase-like lactoylglutathione lyase family enzyme